MHYEDDSRAFTIQNALSYPRAFLSRYRPLRYLRISLDICIIHEHWNDW